MEKTLQEVKLVLSAREAEGAGGEFTAVGLTSRRNLCIHPKVVEFKDKDKVDAECRKLTADWVRGSNK